MASYPTSVKSFTSRNSGDVIQPAHVNDLQDEVNAIEAGLINGTAPLNSSNSTVVHLSATAGLSVVGNSTLGSTITIGGLPYIFPSSGGSTGQVLTVVSTSGSTQTLEWRAPQAVMSLIRAVSGTYDCTQSTSTPISSATITGLTALDRLEVRYTIHNPSTGPASPSVMKLVHGTDGVLISNLTSAGLSTNQVTVGWAELSQVQTASTMLAVFSHAYSAGVSDSTGTVPVTGITTAWTGSWSLEMRQNGSSQAGSLRYNIAFYKVAGQ